MIKPNPAASALQMEGETEKDVRIIAAVVHSLRVERESFLKEGGWSKRSHCHQCRGPGSRE
jgi:hypothetical protein